MVSDIAEPKARADAATTLTKRIRRRNLEAKVIFGRSARRRAYDLKTRLVELALTTLPEFFNVVSFEFAERHGIIVLVRLADGGFVHVPRKSFTFARHLIDLNVLPYESTLASPARRRIQKRAVPVMSA